MEEIGYRVERTLFLPGSKNDSYSVKKKLGIKGRGRCTTRGTRWISLYPIVFKRYNETKQNKGIKCPNFLCEWFSFIFVYLSRAQERNMWPLYESLVNVIINVHFIFFYCSVKYTNNGKIPTHTIEPMKIINITLSSLYMFYL